MTSATQDETVTPAVTPAIPDQYHLHGKDITVSFFPEGAGPVHVEGPLRFAYQDGQRSLEFFGDQVRTVDVPDLGTAVSVTLVELGSFGRTTFSVIIPPVDLPAQNSASIAAPGITAVHVNLLSGSGHPQQTTYRTVKLHGTASIGILPD